MRDRTIRVSKCSVIWTQENIRDYNNSLTVDSVKKTIPVGYWTFNELKDYLKSEYKITIERKKNNRISLTSEKDLDMGTFGPLLGFEKNKSLAKTTTHTSTSQASMSNGLNEIDVFSSSLVNDLKNYSFNNGEYYPSSLLLNIGIDSTQRLNGTISYYNLDNARVPLNDFSGQDIYFDVVSGGDYFDYEIRMSLIIE